METYLAVLKKYADFSGRARRREYWLFTLVNLIVSIVLSAMRVPLLVVIFSLALLLPSLAVAVRRLHDTNRSGWWLLIALVPLIGAIVLLVFAIQEGTRGDNDYGPDPKADVVQAMPAV